MTLKSDEYTAYQAAFCEPLAASTFQRPKTTPFHVRAAHVYQSVQTRFPERFCLAQLIGMFQAFETECPVSELRVKAKQSAWIHPYYDTKHWRADVFHRIWTLKRVDHDSTHIKLSNDGFFYSPTEDYNVTGKAIARHGASFTQLDLSDPDVAAAFRPIIEYGARYLEVSVAELLIHLFHSFDKERIDVEMLNGEKKTMLFVTFEPGYPEEAYLTDSWQTVHFD